jgi:hypothetical protein
MNLFQFTGVYKMEIFQVTKLKAKTDEELVRIPTSFSG